MGAIELMQEQLATLLTEMRELRLSLGDRCKAKDPNEVMNVKQMCEGWGISRRTFVKDYSHLPFISRVKNGSGMKCLRKNFEKYNNTQFGNG